MTSKGEQANERYFGSNTNYIEALELIDAANTQFIDPALQELAQITRAYKQESKELRDNLEKTEETVSGIISEAKEVLARARYFMEKNKVSTSPEMQQVNKSAGEEVLALDNTAQLRLSNTRLSSVIIEPEHCLLEARRSLTRAKDIMNNSLLKTEIPENRYWPDNANIGCGMSICIFIAGIIGASGGFYGFLFFAGGVYGILIFLLYHIPAQRATDSYEKVKGLLRYAEDCATTALATARSACEESLSKAESAVQPRFKDLQQQLLPIAINQIEKLAKLKSYAREGAADWSDEIWAKWGPADTQLNEPTFGTLYSQTQDISETLAELPLPLAIPAFAPFAGGRGLLIEATNSHRKAAIDAMQSLIARLLATIPPGKAFFTFIDPVGLGSQVAPFIRLAEYEKSLVNSQAWTDPALIDKRLAEITEKMETLIQKRLQGRSNTIYEYNEKAKVKEAYRFIFIFDFPSGFTESSYKRLISIAKNGPKCGVFVAIIRDIDKPLPYGCNISEFEGLLAHVLPAGRGVSAGPGVTFSIEEKPYVIENKCYWGLRCDSAPPSEVLKTIIDRTGEQAKEGMKVEVPFEELLDMADLHKPQWKDMDRTTANGILVPLGPNNDQKPQQLSLGLGTAHHGLIVGRTGSGKSNLMHVIITALAWKYSPDEVRLYLLDFKKGVEFEPYARYRLPHAGAIAVESEREFAISVIEQLDLEMNKRDPLFKDSGVNNISEFRRRNHDVVMPRILLLIDEFQELFAIDDALSRKASLLLNRIVLQGRSFGIHVILGTQTLKRAMDLTSATYDQMAIRIALQCSDADSRLILSDDNAAARLLSRPGEAIYNDSAGLLEGNSVFQVARFDDNERYSWLEKIRNLATDNYKDGAVPEPVVFNGRNIPQLEHCGPLKEAFQASTWQFQAKYCDLFLGEPIAIRPPVAARLRRQSGSNLLIITRNEADGLALLTASAASLLISRPPGKLRLCILNFATADEDFEVYPNLLSEVFSDRVKVCSRQREVPSVLDGLASLALGRAEGAQSSELVVLFIVGLQRIKVLRDSYEPDDGNRPIDNLRTILKEGPESGIHTVALSDTWSNARAHLDDRLQSEFSMRVAGMMNADDSRWFIDDDSASKLESRRFLYYDEDTQGSLVKFRPYGLPEPAWVQNISHGLASRN